MKSRVVHIVAAAFAMTVMSCSSSGEAQRPPNRVPIDGQIMGVAADLAALRAQIDLHQAKCMAEQGFPYFGRSARVHLASLVELYSLGILSLSVQDAQDHGYTNTGLKSAATVEEQEYFEGQSQAESDAYQATMLGTEADRRDISTPSGSGLSIPVGGCLGRSVATVYGSVDAYADGEVVFYELQDLMGRVSVEVGEVDEFKTAVGRWSDCMSGHGQSFDSPSQAREAALATRPRQGDGPPDGDPTDSPAAGSSTTGSAPKTTVPVVTNREREIAVADATCQAKVSLPEKFTDAALKVQSSLTSESERLFLSWRELIGRVQAEGYDGVTRDSGDLLSGTGAKAN